MQLIPVTKLIPLRNENGEIYKWQEEALDVSPFQIQKAKHEEALEGHLVLHFRNGEQMIVDGELKAFRKKFNEATA